MRASSLRFLAATCGIILTLTAPLHAAITNYVITTADSGPGSLRQAILNVNAAGAGKILFSNLNGLITLSNMLPTFMADVTIRGAGTERAIRATTTAAAALTIATQATLRIHQLNLDLGGYNIITNAGILTVSSCVLGSIFLTNSGKLILNGCTSEFMFTVTGPGQVVLNRVNITGRSYEPHSLAILGGRAHLENCAFNNHEFRASNGDSVNVEGGRALGAGIHIIGADVSMLNCTVANNSATGGNGYEALLPGGGGSAIGGIYCSTGTLFPSLRMTNCLVSNNMAIGGMAAAGSRRNAASGTGIGGIYFYGKEFWAVNCTVSGNRAVGGDGVFNGMLEPLGGADATGGMRCSSTGALMNCTIVGNQAIGGRGLQGFTVLRSAGLGVGGIRGDLLVQNTIISGNSGSQPILGTTGFSIIPNDGAGRFDSMGHNLIGTTNPLKYLYYSGPAGYLTNVVPFSGLIASDLVGVSPGLGSLQDNGGAVLTYALLAGSPAIDAGINTGIAFDARGQPRTIDNPAVTNAFGGDGTDIGAFEVNHILTGTEARRVGNNIQIRFTTVSDKTYGIEYRPEVGNGLWTKLPGFVSGTGGIATYTDVGAASLPKRFYRLFERAP